MFNAIIGIFSCLVAHLSSLLYFICDRYVPKVETLRQIDNFCSNSIADCDSLSNRGMTSAKSSTFGSVYSLPAHNFVPPPPVKSLNYVRSLVARHIPRLSFPQVTPSQSSNAGNQSLQTLSTLLCRSFNSNLSPESGHNHEIPERKEVLRPSTLDLSSQENMKAGVNDHYIYSDLLKWRWAGAREQSTSTMVAWYLKNFLLNESQVSMSFFYL